MWAKNKKKMGEKVKLEQNEAGKPNKKNETIKKRSTFLEFSEKRFDGGNNTVLLSRLLEEKAMPNQRDPKRTMKKCDDIQTIFDLYLIDLYVKKLEYLQTPSEVRIFLKKIPNRLKDAFLYALALRFAID